MRRIWQATIATIFAVGAAQTGMTLADHAVPATTVAVSIIPMLMVGAFTVRAAGARTRHTYTCPTAGCDMAVTVAGLDAVAERDMRALAVDHTQHTPTTAVNI